MWLSRGKVQTNQRSSFCWEPPVGELGAVQWVPGLQGVSCLAQMEW